MESVVGCITQPNLLINATWGYPSKQQHTADQFDFLECIERDEVPLICSV